MAKIKFEDSYNGFVAFNKAWQCGLSDDIDTELAFHVEIMDIVDATGEGNEDYPFVVSIGIVAANPHESFNENEHESGHCDINQLGLIQDCVNYMGSVPVDHKFLGTDSLNRKITDNLKIGDATLVTSKHDFGTVAAQNGKGSKLTYPQFKTEDTARAWAKEMIKLYADTLMSLSGFILDAPINMIGDTGWSVIEKQVNGGK